jgi:hypothetical protein
MNEDRQANERDDDTTALTEPNDENPGSFFRIPTAPHSNDSWQLN